MASKKPVILVIHGGWHTVAHYQEFIDLLTEKGYTVVAPQLPSSQEPTPENPAEADLKMFSDTARKWADEGHEIIAVPHSYGGVIATEAFSGLGVKTRTAQGLPGGIRTMVCVAAFLLGNGMTLEGNAPADILGWCSYEGDAKILVESFDIGNVFYPDLPKDEQQKWLKLLVKHPKALSFREPKALSYTEIDTVYVYCEKDNAFPYPVQKSVIQAMKGQGVPILEESLPSGHFPSLSMPDRLVEIVLRYA